MVSGLYLNVKPGFTLHQVSAVLEPPYVSWVFFPFTLLLDTDVRAGYLLSSMLLLLMPPCFLHPHITAVDCSMYIVLSVTNKSLLSVVHCMNWIDASWVLSEHTESIMIQIMYILDTSWCRCVHLVTFCEILTWWTWLVHFRYMMSGNCTYCLHLVQYFHDGLDMYILDT
jgi:hypothetical protein